MSIVAGGSQVTNELGLGIEWNTAIQVAVIGAALSAIGWLVSHIVTLYSEHKKQKISWQLDYTSTQLQELYGPLVFLIIEGRQTFKDFLAFLGRSYVFGDKPLPQNELDAWLFWVENEFLPRNKQIHALLSSKTHLIDESKIPDTYIRFIKHYSSWEIKHKRWKVQQAPYAWHSSVNWPMEFEVDVINKFNQIKERHFVLLGRLGSRNRS